MTDRELLELAAKAAGVVVVRSRLDDPACRDMLVENSVRNPHQKFGPWGPLTDDGDALRLAVKLQLTVGNEHINAGVVYCTDRNDREFPEVDVRNNEENIGEITPADYVATRRAIVLAAAEIGKAMP
jgi:hypothetical protein